MLLVLMLLRTGVEKWKSLIRDGQEHLVTLGNRCKQQSSAIVSTRHAMSTVSELERFGLIGGLFT